MKTTEEVGQKNSAASPAKRLVSFGIFSVYAACMFTILTQPTWKPEDIIGASIVSTMAIIGFFLVTWVYGLN